MSIFVVSQVTKGNWQVASAEGRVTDGFKNWALAEGFARNQAIAIDGYVIRLSSKTGEIVSHLKPRQAVPICIRSRDETPAAYIDLAARSAAEHGVTLEETTIDDVVDDIGCHNADTLAYALRFLTTAELVAMYNDAGGNINGKYKGRRATLINAIVAA